MHHNTRLHVFFDFDSTVVTKESLDEVIAYALSEHEDQALLIEKIESITNLGMEGRLPFTESLRQRFEVLSPTKKHFETVGQMLIKHITPDMETVFAFLREKNVSHYIVSGGFRDSIIPVATYLGVPEDRVLTNDCIYDSDGICTINTSLPNYSDDGKAPVLETIKERDQLVGALCMIGDGANDLLAYTSGIADMFIGFTGNKARDLIVQQAPLLAESSTKLIDHLTAYLQKESAV